MKITLPTTPVTNASYKKVETKWKVKTYTALQNCEAGTHIREAARVELYISSSQKASVVHANFWVWGGDDFQTLSGYGTAHGYGYDKHQAAAADAIRSAGIHLDGESDIKTMLTAICEAAGTPVTRVMEF